MSGFRLMGYSMMGVLCAGFWGMHMPEMRPNRPHYNVLFILVDDLRPQLGCYGDRTIQSPNIDRLASRGMVFDRAYCQMALCSPSRTSLLTGLRPETTRIFDLTTSFRQTVPTAVTLPQLFRQAGGYSAAFYKVFHLIPSDPRAFGNLNDTLSWSQPLWLPTKSVYGPKGDSMREGALTRLRQTGQPMNYATIPRGFALEAPDLADSALADGETAREAVRTMARLANQSTAQPFFLAVGFYKPHLPFVAPKRYWDLYDSTTISLPTNRFAPENAPAYALKRYAELTNYEDFKDQPRTTPPSPVDQRKLVHGYMACISYVDAQVGLLLDELDRLKLRDKTVVILLGDHGYQVGQHDMWATKHTNYETSIRTPLLVSLPGQRTAGRHTNALVEFVDVYPTIAELCGLEAPPSLAGKSFVPVLNNPAQRWKKSALSQYPVTIPGQGEGMGRSLRTDRYHLIEWRVPTTNFVEYELYDHRTDPDENTNLAAQAAYKNKVRSLAKELADTWNEAHPK